MCKLQYSSHILRKSSTQIYTICVKLEYLSHILRKRSTQIYAICASLNIYHTFCVKVAHKFTQYVYCLNTYHIFCVKVAHKFTQSNHLGLKIYISRCFSRNLRSWQKNLRDHGRTGRAKYQLCAWNRNLYFWLMFQYILKHEHSKEWDDDWASERKNKERQHLCCCCTFNLNCSRRRIKTKTKYSSRKTKYSSHKTKYSSRKTKYSSPKTKYCSSDKTSSCLKFSDQIVAWLMIIVFV